MKENYLKLVVVKTECVMLTKKRGYREPAFTMSDIRVEPKDSLRYLGIDSEKNLGTEPISDQQLSRQGKQPVL